MDIIVEGPDNSGKSTLVAYLAHSMSMPIERGEGPPQNQHQIETRIRRQHNMLRMQTDFRIHDRSRVVSQQIYGKFKVHNLSDDIVTPEMERELYEELKPLFIYCRGGPLDHNHRAKGYDTPLHLKMLDKEHIRICNLYDQWALKRAHIIYNRFRGDRMEAVLGSAMAHILLGGKACFLTR